MPSICLASRALRHAYVNAIPVERRTSTSLPVRRVYRPYTVRKYNVITLRVTSSPSVLTSSPSVLTSSREKINGKRGTEWVMTCQGQRNSSAWWRAELDRREFCHVRNRILAEDTPGHSPDRQLRILEKPSEYLVKRAVKHGRVKGVKVRWTRENTY